MPERVTTAVERATALPAGLISHLGQEGSPLGCKEGSRQLESSVFNHVSLGQWEPARACVSCLAADPSSRDNAKDLLKILILESNNFWSESVSTPSPHHLSWLALEAYNSLFTDEEDKLPGYVQKLVEFRLLLYSTKGVTSFSARVASQLCHYHDTHVLKIPGAAAESVTPLSSLSLSFIRDIVSVISPALGHALIQALTVPANPHYLSNNQLLQNAYVDCIRECLESLAAISSRDEFETDSSYDSQYESDHASGGGVSSAHRECERLINSVYSLLALIDPVPEMSKLVKKLDSVFHSLLLSEFSVSPELPSLRFETGRIYSCLLGRSSSFLVNRLQEVEEYLRMKSSAESTAESQSVEQGRGGKALSLRSLSSKEEWRDHFYEAIFDHKHILENVLDTGLQLVYTDQLGELTQLFQRPEFEPLCPLLLLLGWDRYPAAGSGKELLDTLWPTAVRTNQRLLFNGCCKLYFQVELVQWCLEKARPHVLTHSPTIHRAGEVFKGLENHSVLYVLHHSTPLASLNHEEVISILELRPRAPSLTVPVTPPPHFSRGTTPLKQPQPTDSEGSPLPFATAAQIQLKPEQKRDITVFKSFYILKLVLDAIWTSIQLNRGLLPPSTLGTTPPKDDSPGKSNEEKSSDSPKLKQPRSKAARKLELGEPEPDRDAPEKPLGVIHEETDPVGDSRDPVLEDRYYMKHVSGKLNEASSYLRAINPINYRLEIMENIFSLLFLTGEDIKHLKVSEEEDSSGVSRSVSAESSTAARRPMLTRMNSEIASTLSSIALIKSKHGFLVSEKIATEILDILHDCIIQLRSNKFDQAKQDQPGSGFAGYSSIPSSVVKCSIANTSFQQRVAKLAQYVNEARWRLQLVSAKHGILAGIIPAPGQRDDREGYSSSAEESFSELSDSEEDEKDDKKEKRKPPSKKVSVTGEQKEDSSPSSLTPRPDSVRPPSGELPATSPYSSATTRPVSIAVNGKTSPMASMPFLSSSLPASRPMPFTMSGPPRLSPKPKRKSFKTSKTHSGIGNNGSAAMTSGTSSKSPDLRHESGKGQLEQDSGECADVEEKSPQDLKKKKRLRSRSSQASSVRKRRMRISERTDSGFSKTSIVCQMLASQGSLLRMCLKHSNYLRASEVLKMFEMQGKFEEEFVRFSELYELVCQELSQKSRSMSPKLSSSQVGPATQMVSTPSTQHMNLQEAIISAKNSSVALESLHRLLRPTSINDMLFSGDEQYEKLAQDSAMLQTLKDHVPALVELDIVCSSRVDGQVAKRILELASGRCQAVMERLHSKADHRKSSRLSQPHDVVLGGPFALLQTLSDVSGYFTFFGALPSPEGLVPPPHTSPHALLTTFTHHFRVSSVMNTKSFADSYREAREKLENKVSQWQLYLDSRAIASTSELFTAESSPSVEESISASLQRSKRIVAGVFDELIRSLRSNPHSPVLPGSLRERSLMRHASVGSLQRLSSLDESSPPPAASFLWQFSRYVAKLVELLVKCFGRAPSSGESSLLLAVLRERPAHLLGRLVFELGIHPHKLELLMGDFPHLHIIEALVKCCCPQLPSAAMVTTSKVGVLCEQPVVVLNKGESSSALVPDLCTFSHKLLSKLLKILRNSSSFSHSQDGVVGPDDLAAAYSSPEVKKILAKTCMFADVDLECLGTQPRQMAFYSNVSNLLYAHAVMLYLSEEVKVQGGVASDLGMAASSITMATMQSSRVVQAAYFSKVGYRIGSLGVVSCYDLHHCILRKGLTPPKLVESSAGIKFRLAPSQPDPWCQYVPLSPDPRLLYVMHDGRVSSPIPVALTPDEITSSLRSAESWYLGSSVLIDLPKKEVCIPQWLFNHRDDFVKPVWNEGTSANSAGAPHSYLSDLALLKYIQPRLPKEQGDVLLPSIESSEASRGRKLAVKLVVIPDRQTFGFDFSSRRISAKSPKTSPQISRKRKGNGKTDRDKSGANSPITSAEKSVTIKYSFTPETLSFVKQQSPLMAAMVHLLCPPVQTQPLTDRAGKTAKLPHEDETEEEEEESRDEDEAPPKRSFIQSIRNRGRPSVKKSSAVPEEKPTYSWRRQFGDILTHFGSFPALRQYLSVRLASFDSLIPWDSKELVTKSSPKEISVDLRMLAALPSSSPELGVACGYVMRQLLESGKAHHAVKFLSSEPAISHLREVRYLSDMALSCVFATHYCQTIALGHSGDDSRENVTKNSPISILARLSDTELATRLTLASLHNWPVEVCVDLLSYCTHHLPPSSVLSPVLSKMLEKMRVYAKIMVSCESPLPGYQSARSPWKCWSDLASDSESKQSYVLRILLASKEFELARNWSVVHGLSQSISQQIEVDYIFNLLEGDSPDPITAHQVLDSLSDGLVTLGVCEAVLKQGSHLQTTIFVLHYMLTRLEHSLDMDKTKSYCNRLLGAKALLCLPLSSRRPYEDFISQPLLLVEQLLIDTKIEWATSVMQQLRADEHLPQISTSDSPELEHPPVIEDRDRADPFTSLLMFYSGKALEFPVLSHSGSSGPPPRTVPPSAMPSRPVSPGIQASHGTSTQRQTPSQARNIPQSIPLDRGAAGGEHEGQYASDQYPVMTPIGTSSFRWKSRTASITSPTHFLSGIQEQEFDLPSEPPSKHHWEKDAEATNCRVCKGAFGMFSRRHHCRRCGRVVCASCSTQMVLIKPYQRPVRVCDDCHPHCNTQTNPSDDSAQTAPSVQPDDQTALGSVYPALATSPCHNFTLLPEDPHYNVNVRKAFYYERTPNTALCLSLVDLISNKRVAAGFIMDCCRTVSTQLRPDSQGRVNEEVDDHFVIGLIQNLLLNAKLRFADAADSPGVELCDTYLSRVDLLRLLVSSRCSKIPSIQELTKPDLTRRVRDRLIQDDRFNLAMEVSTKCQLDTGAVWSAWGMACLKCGDFSGARTRFRHCFQVSSQSKMAGTGSQNLQLLQRIVEQIELNPVATTHRQTVYSEDWTNVITVCMAPPQRWSEGSDLDAYRFNECTYYLRTYGTPGSLVAFFVRHNCWMDACSYILENNCPVDVFVDQLWVPALRTGLIEQVQESLRSLDPTLCVWEPYLTGACRYFTQRSLFSILYNTQCFMKDYIRAGMTCIKFFIGFSGRATTIAGLFSRLHYLSVAKKHFHSSLEAAQVRPQDKRSGRSKGLRGQPADMMGPGAKTLPSRELQRHIETIDLQKQVTNFLYESAEVMGTVAEPLLVSTSSGADAARSSPQQPATLFGNGHLRAEVAVQLLTQSPDVIEGFRLAEEIVQAFKLPADRIFCETARRLAKKQDYSNIRLLLQSVQKSQRLPRSLSPDALNDEIIMSAIKVLASQSREAKQVEKLVQALTSERSKIKALVQCGRLKNAYLVAIRARMVDEVRNISEIAGKAGQLAVRDICDRWLETNSHGGGAGGGR